jgi:hypothetical protein
MTSGPATTAAPALVFAYFELAHVRTLLDAIAAADIPPGTDVYVGTYGPGREVAEAVRSVPGVRYAPMFSIQPGTSRRAYAGRQLSPDEAASLDPRYAGAIPRSQPLAPLASSDRHAWGRELGCRFRDSIRRARREGVEVATWQFDELLREVAGFASAAQQRAHREYTTGILEGLLHGRPELGDAAEQGLVWVAGSALRRLPTVPVSSPGVEAFWQALNEAASLYVGQEYVPFRGAPQARARESAVGQQLLLKEGVIRPQLGRRYAVGMTPGYHSRKDILGGNVDGLSPSAVDRWRERFVRERTALAPVAGFAQFNFCEGNRSPGPTVGAVRAAALGIRPGGRIETGATTA